MWGVLFVIILSALLHQGGGKAPGNFQSDFIQNPFPLFFEGSASSTEQTFLTAIAYSSQNSMLAVGGHTQDMDLLESQTTGTYLPIVSLHDVSYSIPQMQFYITLPGHMLDQLTFSPDGGRLLAHTTGELSVTAGGTKQCLVTFKTTSVAMQMTKCHFIGDFFGTSRGRSIILDRDNNAYVLSYDTSETQLNSPFFYKKLIYGVDMFNQSTSTTFSYKTLLFSYLYSLALDPFSGSIYDYSNHGNGYAMMTKLTLSSLELQLEWSLRIVENDPTDEGVIDFFQTALADSVLVAQTSPYASTPQFTFRWFTGPQDPVVNEYLHYPSVQQLEGYRLIDIKVETYLEYFSLLTYSPSAGVFLFKYSILQMSVAMVSVSPQIYTTDVIVNGVLGGSETGYNAFLLTSIIDLNLYTALPKMNVKRVLNAVEQLNSDYTCYQQAVSSTPETSSLQHAILQFDQVTDLGMVYDMVNTIQLAFSSSNSGLVAEFSYSRFQSYSCVCGSHPPLTINANSTQAFSNIRYADISSVVIQVLEIENFVYSWDTISHCPKSYDFTYTAKFANGSALSAPYSFDPLAVAINIATTSTKYSEQIIINGTIPELEVSEVVTITVVIDGNYGPPYFQPALPNVYAPKGAITQFQLPTPKDPDNEVVTLEINFGSASSFSTYTPETNIGIVQAGDDMGGQAYQIVVIATDTNRRPLAKKYTFLLYITDPSKALDTSIKDCKKEPFPKILASPNPDAVYFFTSAYNQRTSSFAAAGYTNSRALTQSSAVIRYPLIVKYSGAHWQMEWTKYFAIDGFAVFNLVFSPDSEHMAALYERIDQNPPTPMISVLDGTGSVVYTLKMQNRNLFITLDFTRIILLSDQSVILNMKKLDESATNDPSSRKYVVFRATNQATTSSWALTSVTDAQNGNIILGHDVDSVILQSCHLTTPQNQGILGLLYGVSTSSPAFRWVATRSTGSFLSAQLDSLQLNATHAIAVQAYYTPSPIKYKLRRTVFTLYPTSVDVQEDLFSHNVFAGGNGTTLNLHTLKVLSENKVQALMTNMPLFKTFLVTFNFDFGSQYSTKVKYTIIDPQPQVRQYVRSIIFAENKYISLTHTSGVYLGIDFGIKAVGFIFTNSPELSCWDTPLTEYEKMDVEALTKETGTFTLTYPQLFSNLVSVGYTIETMTTSSILPADIQVTNKPGSICEIPELKLSSSVAMNPESLQLIANSNQRPQTVTFSPFEAGPATSTFTCAAPITYEYGVITSDPNIDMAVTTQFDQGGSLTFSDAKKIGTYSIKVFAYLPNGQVVYTNQLLIVIVGNPNAPAFMSKLDNKVTITPGIPFSLSLPDYSDLDGEAVTITVSNELSGVSLSNDKKSLEFQLAYTAPAGIWEVIVTLTDNNPYIQRQTASLIEVTVRETLVVKEQASCFGEPFPKIVACLHPYSVYPIILDVSDNYIVVAGKADSLCFKTSSGLFAFFLIAYDIETGKQVWGITLEHNDEVIDDITQLLIDEQSDSLFIQVQFETYPRILQLQLSMGRIQSVIALNNHVGVTFEYMKRMAVIPPMSIAFFAYNSQQLALLYILDFSVTGSPLTLGMYQIGNIPIEYYSMSFEPSTSTLVTSFGKGGPKFERTLITHKYIDGLLTESSNLGYSFYQDDFVLDSVSTVDVKYDEVDLCYGMVLYYYKLQLTGKSYYQLHIQTESQSLISSFDKSFSLQGPYPIPIALKIESPSSAIIALLDQDTLQASIVVATGDQFIHYQLGETKIYGDNLRFIHFKSRDLFTFVQGQPTTTLVNSQQTIFSTYASNSMHLHTTLNPENSCNSILLVNSRVPLDQEATQLTADATELTFVSVIPDSFNQEAYFVVGLVDPSIQQLQPQVLCVKRTHTILAPLPYTLTFNSKEVNTQSKQLTPFSLLDTTCTSQSTFEYQMTLVNGMDLPNEFSLIGDTLSMAYTPESYLIETIVTGTLVQTRLFETVRVTIIVKVANRGPPLFAKPLIPLLVQAGEKLTYSLPAYADPDGDEVQVAVNLMSAVSFSQYSQGTIQFNPPVTISTLKIFLVSITLSDSEGLYSSYSLSITVVPNIKAQIKDKVQDLIDSGLPLNQSTNGTIKDRIADKVENIKNQIISKSDLIITDDSDYYVNLTKATDGKKKEQVILANLTAKISSVSNRGLVTIAFSHLVQPVRNFNEILKDALKVTLVTQGQSALASWNHTGGNMSTSFDKLQLQLNFSDPILISQSKPFDEVQIIFVGNGLFRRQSDKRPIRYRYIITESIPLQIIDSPAIKTLESAGGSASDIMSYMGYSLLVMQIFMSVSMSLLWGLMHTMQIIIHLRMLNVFMPINAQMVLAFIEKLASFKIGKKIRNYLVEQIFLFLEKDEGDNDGTIGVDDPQESLQNVKLLLFGLIVFGALTIIFTTAYLLRRKLPMQAIPIQITDPLVSTRSRTNCRASSSTTGS